MKRLFLLFLLLASSSFSYAVTVPAELFFNAQNTNFYGTAGVLYNKDPSVVCKAAYERNFAGVGSLIKYNVTFSNTLSPGCYFQYMPYNSTTAQNVSNPLSWSLKCPVGMSPDSTLVKTPSTVTCSSQTCPASMTPVNGVCVDVCNPKKGNDATININCASSNAPSLVCMPDSCVAQMTGSAVGQKNGCYFGYAYGKYNGQTCTGQPNSTNYSNPTQAPVEPEPSPETDCIKQGKTFGSVNGVTVCVPKTSSGGAPTTTKTETTTTTTNTDTNGNTSTNTAATTKETTKDGENIKEVTTKQNADGTKTEEVKTMPVGEFCVQNPSHSLCKTASEKEEEGADPCEDNPDLPQCLALGTPTDGDAIGTETRTVSFTAVDITSGGSCPPDKSLSVAGRSLTFSYSWLCEYASSFRPFMLAFAYLSAAMFLFWGYKGAQT